MTNLITIPWDGTPISKPGMYSRVPMTAYHEQLTAGVSISSSGLRKIDSKSCADYFDSSYLNPNRSDDDDEKDYFILGRAIHHLILGQPFFTKLFVQRPDKIAERVTGKLVPWNGNRTECRNWLDEQRKRGLTVLTPDQIEAIKGMAFSLGRDPLVRSGILNGLVERSIVAQDPTTGVWLKIRPDSFPKGSLDFVNLKTTTSVLPPDLSSTIRKNRYHMEAALTRMVLRLAFKLEMSSYTHLFVQKTRPYSIGMVEVDAQDIDRGEELNRIALRKFVNCLKTKEWPGPIEPGHIIKLGLSEDERNRIDRQIDREKGLGS